MRAGILSGLVFVTWAVAIKVPGTYSPQYLFNVWMNEWVPGFFCYTVVSFSVFSGPTLRGFSFIKKAPAWSVFISADITQDLIEFHYQAAQMVRKRPNLLSHLFLSQWFRRTLTWMSEALRSSTQLSDHVNPSISWALLHFSREHAFPA